MDAMHNPVFLIRIPMSLEEFQLHMSPKPLTLVQGPHLEINKGSMMTMAALRHD